MMMRRRLMGKGSLIALPGAAWGLGRPLGRAHAHTVHTHLANNDIQADACVFARSARADRDDEDTACSPPTERVSCSPERTRYQYLCPLSCCYLRFAHMGWQEEQAQRQRRKQQPSDSTEQKQTAQPKPRGNANALFVTVAAAAVLLPLAHRLGWLDAAQDAIEDALGVTLPWRQDGDDEDAAGVSDAPRDVVGGGRSAFRFPPSKPGGAPAAKTKRNTKKLSRQERQQRNADRADKRRPAALPGTVGTLPEGPPVAGSVPKDSDYVGGEAALALRTNSTYYTSAMDKRVAEEARAAVRCVCVVVSQNSLPLSGLTAFHSCLQKALLR